MAAPIPSIDPISSSGLRSTKSRRPVKFPMSARFSQRLERRPSPVISGAKNKMAKAAPMIWTVNMSISP